MPAYLWMILVLSALGILDTLYLSYHTITKIPVKCLFFPQKWCHDVQYSSYSNTFGIPNSIAGLALYIAIFVSTILFIKGFWSFSPVFYLVIVGFVFSIYYLLVQAFVIRSFCSWCLISAIEFTLLFATVLIK